MISWSRSTRPRARTFLSAAPWLNVPVSRTKIQRWRDESDAGRVIHRVRRPEARGGTKTHVGCWEGTCPDHSSRRHPAGPHHPVRRLPTSDGAFDTGE